MQTPYAPRPGSVPVALEAAREQVVEVVPAELVAEALRTARVVSDVISSEVSPSDLCRWRIYSGTYHLLKGTDPISTEIRGYNTSPPGSTAAPI